jgi:hypothetical protein
MGAESKPTLIGATRDEVLARLGEPKSNIVAGNREVLFFTGERIVLRNNRVIEVEDVPVEAPAAPTRPAGAVAGAQDEKTAESPAATKPAAPTAATEPASKPAAADSASESAPTAGTDAATPTAVAAPEPEVVIKSVRPPSRGGASGSAQTSATRAAAAPVTAVASPEPPKTSAPTGGKASIAVPPHAEVVAPSPVAKQTAAPAASSATSGSVAAANATAGSGTSAASEPVPQETASEVAEPRKLEAAAVAPTTHAAPRAASAPQFPSVVDSIFTRRTYLLGFLVIGAGIGYLVWRRRNKQLILAATAVSHSPFMPEPPAAPGTRFTQDLLNKLEWKRFEELVAAYYNKTGVVASRTKSGPAAPVHIRISWKGEQRPFACVHCIAQPSGLLGPKPVQSLCEVLAAEDIRRGYVVTAGKFGVPARDLAEEKQVTLLPGDIFLEKLNALPDPARAELMKDATAGDYMTPTCPRCETKMSRSLSDPTLWQCPQCGTLLPKS